MAASARAAGRFRALSTALAAGLDWRLIIVWVAGALVPTLIATLPVWRTLADLLDLSPQSPDLARHFDMLAFEDLWVRLRDTQPAHGGALIAALVCFILVSPLMTAAILATAAEGRSHGFIELLRRALDWYGRSFRIWLLLLLPAALVLGAASYLQKAANDYAEKALLESRADFASHAALVATVLLAVLLHVGVEAGRAELVANPERRSALLALGRGVQKALARPIDTLVLYFVPSVLGLLLAGLLMLARLHVTGASRAGLVVGSLIAQLAVASIGWGHGSRLFALSALFRPETDAR